MRLQLEAAIAGLGIAVMPAFAFPEAIERGDVEALRRDYEPKPLPMSAIYPSRRFLSIKVRAMIDYFAHEFALDARLAAHAF